MAVGDPGSFRDPASHIVYEDGRVLRLLDQRGRQGWEALAASSFLEKAVADGRLIESKLVDHEGAAGALEHPRIPFISYPYEWTFSMLKDAALLQLDLLSDALQQGLTIKDATPYNIQFIDGSPVFIDIGSFEKYSSGEPWIGYRQFTRQFLFPLMMRAWAGLAFQPWLRGDMEGPTAAEMREILSFGKRMKPAVLMHVSLQARMEERLEGAAVRSDLKSAGFSADLILANVRKLRKLVSGLHWDGSDRGWVHYDECTHVGRDRETKGRFLSNVLERHGSKRVLDLGANDGFFTEIAINSGAVGIAVDGDEQVLDALYRGGTKASIVLTDLTNPSPAQGWAGTERPALTTRAEPDLVIAYGLIHHLIYTASIPPTTVVDWLASFRCPVVVEFVAPSDPMVDTLTANKTAEELHPGRTRAEFEAIMSPRFGIVATEELGGGDRVLYSLVPVES
ncbi:MAG: methyltransferase [Acidimicrobiia bacterium]